jgi:Fe-S-cluster containining protein
MFDINHDKIITNSFLKEIDFKCQRCSACCRSFPGAVYLTKKDIKKITNYLKIDKNQFIIKYCRPIVKNEKKIISLKEKANYDCIFWDKCCIIYPARPIQCSTYPFWPSILRSRQSWEEEKKYCKGINKKGNLTLKQKIKKILAERKAIYSEYPENI